MGLGREVPGLCLPQLHARQDGHRLAFPHPVAEVLRDADDLPLNPGTDPRHPVRIELDGRRAADRRGGAPGRQGAHLDADGFGLLGPDGDAPRGAAVLSAVPSFLVAAVVMTASFSVLLFAVAAVIMGRGVGSGLLRRGGGAGGRLGLPASTAGYKNGGNQEAA